VSLSKNKAQKRHSALGIFSSVKWHIILGEDWRILLKNSVKNVILHLSLLRFIFVAQN